MFINITFGLATPNVLYLLPPQRSALLVPLAEGQFIGIHLFNSPSIIKMEYRQLVDGEGVVLFAMFSTASKRAINKTTKRIKQQLLFDTLISLTHYTFRYNVS